MGTPTRHWLTRLERAAVLLSELGTLCCAPRSPVWLCQSHLPFLRPPPPAAAMTWRCVCRPSPARCWWVGCGSVGGPQPGGICRHMQSCYGMSCLAGALRPPRPWHTPAWTHTSCAAPALTLTGGGRRVCAADRGPRGGGAGRWRGAGDAAGSRLLRVRSAAGGRASRYQAGCGAWWVWSIIRPHAVRLHPGCQPDGSCSVRSEQSHVLVDVASRNTCP